MVIRNRWADVPGMESMEPAGIRSEAFGPDWSVIIRRVGYIQVFITIHIDQLELAGTKEIGAARISDEQGIGPGAQRTT